MISEKLKAKLKIKNLTPIEKGIFEIEGTKTLLKISKNESEYKASQLIKRHENELKNNFLIPITIDKEENEFYFTFEKLNKLDEVYHRILKSVEYRLNEVNIENLNSLEAKKEEVIEYLKSKGFTQYDEFLQFLINANKQLNKFKLSDIHGNNILIDQNKKFKIIDPQLED
ncbi:hypothetical protein [Chryseobacterium sp.]|uniref:hypothetical protein n=1 Tax=Chryseobacterium sp. TaxID=1871047 RepID=UPI0028A2988F|nr:hypothetical protein [Chryseobacterium sp.]